MPRPGLNSLVGLGIGVRIGRWGLPVDVLWMWNWTGGRFSGFEVFCVRVAVLKCGRLQGFVTWRIDREVGFLGRGFEWSDEEGL